jgi:hypothetical protein
VLESRCWGSRTNVLESRCWGSRTNFLSRILRASTVRENNVVYETDKL